MKSTAKILKLVVNRLAVEPIIPCTVEKCSASANVAVLVLVPPTSTVLCSTNVLV